MENTRTQAINEARDAMENARQMWLDAVQARVWGPHLETPFGVPLAGSYRAFLEASKRWAELVLNANDYNMKGGSI